MKVAAVAALSNNHTASSAPEGKTSAAPDQVKDMADSDARTLLDAATMRQDDAATLPDATTEAPSKEASNTEAANEEATAKEATNLEQANAPAPSQPKPRRASTTAVTAVRLSQAQIENLSSDKSSILRGKGSRTVGELRPKPGLVLTPEETVGQAAREMAAARTDAALVLSSTSEGATLEGILTDTDVVRKVLSEGLEPEEVSVRDVMTAKPICVKEDWFAIDALEKMLELHCRHLPVIRSTDGQVVGLLDISKAHLNGIQTWDRCDHEQTC